MLGKVERLGKLFVIHHVGHFHAPAARTDPMGHRTGLDATFADNIGADAALFQSQSFATFATSDLVAFTVMFNYDPGMGDLLVDIVFVGNESGPPYLSAIQDVLSARLFVRFYSDS